MSAAIVGQYAIKSASKIPGPAIGSRNGMMPLEPRASAIRNGQVKPKASKKYVGKGCLWTNDRFVGTETSASMSIKISYLPMDFEQS
jgi:hypothetical protein